MPKLGEILHNPDLNGVYRLRGPHPEVPGCARIDARATPDTATLLAAIGHTLDFPDYYGGNWDALEECLLDLSWREGPAHLLIEHADALDARALATLIEIWREAVAQWRNEGRALSLLLSDIQEDTLERVD